MKDKHPLLITSFILSVVSLVLTCVIYSSLPAEIAIHFGLSGEANGFGPRIIIFFTGLLPFFLLGLFIIVPRIDPRKQSYKQHDKVYQLFIFLTLLILFFVHWSIILIAFDIPIAINKFIPVIIGLLFIIMGNYMPRIRSNYTLGIRTPWALENTDNWRITQRTGGYCFIVAGLLFLLGIFFSATIQGILFGISIAVILIVPTLVSYINFKKNISNK